MHSSMDTSTTDSTRGDITVKQAMHVAYETRRRLTYTVRALSRQSKSGGMKRVTQKATAAVRNTSYQTFRNEKTASMSTAPIYYAYPQQRCQYVGNNEFSTPRAGVCWAVTPGQTTCYHPRSSNSPKVSNSTGRPATEAAAGVTVLPTKEFR